MARTAISPKTQATIDRLAGVPTDPGFVLYEITSAPSSRVGRACAW